MTQSEKILNLLRSKKWVSNIELNDICFRYSARLHDLKKKGYIVEKKKHPDKPSIFLYSLTRDPDSMSFMERIKPTETAVETARKIKTEQQALEPQLLLF